VYNDNILKDLFSAGKKAAAAAAVVVVIGLVGCSAPCSLVVEKRKKKSPYSLVACALGSRIVL